MSTTTNIAGWHISRAESGDIYISPPLGRGPGISLPASAPNHGTPSGRVLFALASSLLDNGVGIESSKTAVHPIPAKGQKWRYAVLGDDVNAFVGTIVDISGKTITFRIDRSTTLADAWPTRVFYQRSAVTLLELVPDEVEDNPPPPHREKAAEYACSDPVRIDPTGNVSIRAVPSLGNVLGEIFGSAPPSPEEPAAGQVWRFTIGLATHVSEAELLDVTPGTLKVRHVGAHDRVERLSRDGVHLIERVPSEENPF